MSKIKKKESNNKKEKERKDIKTDKQNRDEERKKGRKKEGRKKERKKERKKRRTNIINYSWATLACKQCTFVSSQICHSFVFKIIIFFHNQFFYLPHIDYHLFGAPEKYTEYVSTFVWVVSVDVPSN
jgi:hypothetical protein